MNIAKFGQLAYEAAHNTHDAYDEAETLCMVNAILAILVDQPVVESLVAVLDVLKWLNDEIPLETKTLVETSPVMN